MGLTGGGGSFIQNIPAKIFLEVKNYLWPIRFILEDRFPLCLLIYIQFEAHFLLIVTKTTKSLFVVLIYSGG